MRFSECEMHHRGAEMHRARADFDPTNAPDVCIVFHKVINSCGKVFSVDKYPSENPVIAGFFDGHATGKPPFPQRM